MNIQNKKGIAILGGGPSGFFMLKRLVESGRKDLSIHIFEGKRQLGAGTPYSKEGAGDENITNVSGNEIPDLAEYRIEDILTPEQKEQFRLSIYSGRWSSD